MATIDPNGVLIYQDTDNYTPIQTALNLAQSNLSSILGANTQIVRVSSVGDRNAKATARGSISKANPFVAWRADAADGLQLEYTTNGTTWRTIADKDYYDAQDTGWQTLSPAAGWTVTSTNLVQGRRIGSVVFFRGILQANTANPTTILGAGGIPATMLPVGQNPVLPIAATSASPGRVTVGTNGSLTYAGAISATQYIYLNSVTYPVG